MEETKKWVLSPERKASKKEREYAAARLDGVITKIKNAMQGALAKIQRTLMQPEMKQTGKEQIKEKARESIKDRMARAKVRADRDNRERWEREGRIDCYWGYPSVHNEEEYGHYLVDELEEPELPEEAKKYFMYEEYGRDASINDGGMFTEQGYIYNNRNTFTEWLYQQGRLRINATATAY